MTIMPIIVLTLEINFKERNELHSNVVYHGMIYDDDETDNQNVNVLTYFIRIFVVYEFNTVT